MFRVLSTSDEWGTCALVRVRDEQFGEAACLVAPTRLLPSTSSAQLSRARIYIPLRADSGWIGEVRLEPEWVRLAWTDAHAGIAFVELSPDGLHWALARGATSHALASHAAAAHTLIRVHRDGNWSETRKEVRVEAAEAGALQLSEATDEGMLLDADERLVACVAADDSKTAVRLDKVADDFLIDRRRLFR